MRTFVRAIETETGFSFEQEVYSDDERDKLIDSLGADGYERIEAVEAWSNLDEMYAALEDDEIDEGNC
jgi:hypothetical protein